MAAANNTTTATPANLRRVGGTTFSRPPCHVLALIDHVGLDVAISMVNQ